VKNENRQRVRQQAEELNKLYELEQNENESMIMDELNKVNEEIEKQKAIQRRRKWDKNNPEKKRGLNKKWMEEKGREYHREYYHKKRK